MTKHIKEKDIDNDMLLEISQAIKQGKIVVFKTDTVYGMGANAFDEKACKRIYEIKDRPLNKPLIVLISDISMLKELVEEISPIEQKLIDTFWPGPLTIKFRKKKNVLPEIISSKDECVTFRLIQNGLAYHLAKMANVPIVAPSANLSGSPTGSKIKNVIHELDGKVDYLIDSGDIHNDATSTIVQVSDEKVIILREGIIKQEKIEEIAPVKTLTEA